MSAPRPSRRRSAPGGVTAGHVAADVDHGATGLPEIWQRRERAVHHTEVVHLEEAPCILCRDLGQRPEETDAGVVDPGVDAAERLDRPAGHGVHLVKAGHVATHGDRRRTVAIQLLGSLTQDRLVARHHHDARPCNRSVLGRRQPDTARCTRDHQHLVPQRTAHARTQRLPHGITISACGCRSRPASDHP